MPRPLQNRRRFTSLFASMGLLACAEPTKSTEDPTLEVFVWWEVASEEAAFDALATKYADKSSGVEVDKAVAEGSNKLRDDLIPRLLMGDPPASFQANVGASTLSWTKFRLAGYEPDKVDNLLLDVGSELVATGALEETYPEVLDGVCAVDEEIGDEQFFGVPLNVHQTNLMYVNRALVSTWPLTIEDVCPAEPTQEFPYKIAIGLSDGFSVLTLAFENILPALAGADFYRDLLTGLQPDAWEDKVRSVLNCFRHLSGSFAAADDWSIAVRNVINEVPRAAPPALTVMGDWANAEFAPENRQYFERIHFPGTEQVYVYTSDAFLLPKTAPHRSQVRHLLRFFAGLEAQLTFSLKKGSIPARSLEGPFDSETASLVTELFENPWAQASYDAFRGDDASSEDDAASEDKMKKIPATSGLFPSSFDQDKLVTLLVALSNKENTPGVTESLKQEIVDLLRGSFSMFRRWHSSVQPCERFRQ